ncbi:DMT family transporter [Vibrio sp. T187]|uniref:DMT family transporter n=1 Tax=Vibrio TaxID=662 RepID=UPI0010C9EA02|nr:MULTISPECIES: DMT family transporter [Vibrio]MBW3697423.1 DMT family transporter [Vibrio sp. T187]
MSSQSVAVLLLVLGNLLAALSDVSVKVLDGAVSPYQYMFARQLLSLIFIFPLWILQNKAQRTLKQSKVTFLRAHLILIGSGCMVVAVTYLPLATANAVFYAAPLLMLPLSIVLLKETPPLTKVIATVIGFIGVMIVLRPSQFHWAAFFALGTACTLALFNVLVRKLPSEQTVITTLWWTTLFSIPVSLGLCLLYWQPVSWEALGYVALSAICILSYNGLAVAAYRKAPAGQIALAEYSGLIFVTLFGIWWFSEVPDWLTAAGILLIILPLMPLKRAKRKKSPCKATEF